LSFFRKFRKGYNNNKPGTDSDAIFSLSSAYITLETKLGLKSTGRCALSLKSIDGMHFTEMKDDIQRFLNIGKSDVELSNRMIVDSYGYLWVILDGKSMGDILAGISAVGDTIQEKGFSNQLLVAIFEFNNKEKPNNGDSIQYLVYNYKFNKFYPFVPFGQKTRNSENEMKIMATIADEVPFEKDMTLWYPLWDLPF
jgi:PspAB-like protein